MIENFQQPNLLYQKGPTCMLTSNHILKFFSCNIRTVFYLSICNFFYKKLRTVPKKEVIDWPKQIMLQTNEVKCANLWNAA